MACLRHHKAECATCLHTDGAVWEMDKFITKDSGEREEYSTGMRRDSAKKHLRPDLIDQTMLRRWAELMGRGAEKYGERNWELASTEIELQRFRASAARHFFQWFNKLDREEDHGAALMFNVAGAEMVEAKLNANKKIS
jgi:hypothetical protein